MSVVGVVVAVNPEGVIGRDNLVPWHRPADLRRFKRLTQGGTVIMGRLTFESIGRPLPHRRNLVVSASGRLGPRAGIEVVPSLAAALGASEGPVFVIGGARLFAEACRGPADFVDLTVVPDDVPAEGSVLFPPLDPTLWFLAHARRNDEDPELWHRRYERLTATGPRPPSGA